MSYLSKIHGKNLIVGETYTNNEGEILKIVSCLNDNHFADEEGCTYRKDGKIISDDREFSQRYDLQEIKEQPRKIIGD